MRNNFFSYLRIQFKRYLKGLPLILSITILLLVAIGLIAFSYAKNYLESEDANLATIGIVGDFEGDYVGLGIAAIETFDASRNVIKFEEMDEAEAIKRLSSGDITAYVVAPDGFIDDTVNGKEPKLTIVGRGTGGVGGIIIKEISEVISKYLMDSETATYAMQDIVYDHGNQDAYGSVAENFSIFIVTNLFARDDATKPVLLGISNSSNILSYYLCGFSIFFLLLVGISFSGIFIRQNRNNQKFASAKGISTGAQIIAEYLCYLISILLITAIIVGIVAIVIQFGNLHEDAIKNALGIKLTGEFRWYSLVQILWSIYVKWFPIIAVISALQFLIYELSSGVISSVLAQFIASITLGFISGLFYPISFFPVVIQKISGVLPIGIAMDYAQSAFRFENDNLKTVFLLAYAIVFIIIGWLYRRTRINKN